MASVHDLLAKAGRAAVAPGTALTLAVDYCLVNDAAAHQSLDYLAAGEALFDPARIAVVLDHDTPSGTEAVSAIQRKLINFARQQETLFYNGAGVGYQLLLDAHVQAGNVVAGCGEHLAVFGAVGALGVKLTPQALAETMKTGQLTMPKPDVVKVVLTGRLKPSVLAKDLILTVLRELGTAKMAGKIIEFSGDAFAHLTLSDRITLCNLAGRTGAVAALVDADGLADGACLQLDLGCVFVCLAKPDNFEDIVEVEQLPTIPVNEVFVGGCSGGRIEDLRVAAGLVRGKQVARGVRLMVAPVTSQVYVQALQEGLIDDFVDAGAVVMNQGCSVCWGKSQGIIDTDEVLVSAGSYNCKGCAGAPTAKIYLASAATAAASAIAGVITPAQPVKEVQTV